MNDLVQMTGGALTLGGVSTFQFNLLDGVLAPGSYTLVTGGSSTVGGVANLAHNLPVGSRQSFFL